MRQNKLKEAIAELDEAIRLQPDYALAYNARGFVYYLLRQYPRALQELDAALRIKPDYVNAFQNRALARKASGDAKGSAEDLARAAALGRK